MAERPPQPPSDFEIWGKSQQLFGEKGVIMSLYQNFGYLVAEPTVDADVEGGNNAVDVPYLPPPREKNIGITSFLVACVGPLDEGPEHLARRPYLELPQLGISSIVEMSVVPQSGYARQLLIKVDKEEGLELRKAMVFDNEQHVSGSHQTIAGVRPMNADALDFTVTDMLQTLRGAQRLFERGHYDVKRPFDGN